MQLRLYKRACNTHTEKLISKNVLVIVVCSGQESACGEGIEQGTHTHTHTHTHGENIFQRIFGPVSYIQTKKPPVEKVSSKAHTHYIDPRERLGQF